MLDCSNLIGKPFEWGGRGPDRYDCYGLLMQCYRDCRQIELKDFQSPDHREEFARKMTHTTAMIDQGMRDWVRLDERMDYAGVLIRVRGYAAHIGFVLPHGKFIHTWEKSGGVVIERLDSWRSRIVGYYDYR